MFSIGVFLILTFVSYLLYRYYTRIKNTSIDLEFIVAGFTIVLGIIAVVFIIIITSFPYASQLNDFSKIRGIETKIAVLKERKDSLTVMVKTELDKYPEYEKGIIKGLGDAQILFRYPELRSNETISKTVDDIVKIQDAVYNSRIELIELQRIIYSREVSPWFVYVTPYTKFFGERNPILLENENPVH